MKRYKQNIVAIISVLTLILTVSCTRDRKAKDDPNNGPSTKLIRPMSSLKTLGEPTKKDFALPQNILSADKNLKIEGHVIVTSASSSIENLSNAETVEVVNDTINYMDADGKSRQYTFPEEVGVLDTNAELLDGIKDKIKLLGKSSKIYNISYVTSPEYVKVYRSIPKNELGDQVSLSLSKDKKLELIGGFPVEYFVKEKARTSEGKDTKIRNYKPLKPSQYKSAQFFRIDKKGFVPYQRLSKVDYLPADYFTSSDWYYGSTIITAKPGQTVGYISGTLDSSFQKLATKIKFIQQKGALRGVNVVLDDRVKVGKDQLDDVINIPVAWVEHIKNVDGLDESPLSEINNTLVKEEERSFGNFNFKDSVLGTGAAAAVRRLGVVQDPNARLSQGQVDNFVNSLVLINQPTVSAIVINKKEEQLLADYPLLSDLAHKTATNNHFHNHGLSCSGLTHIQKDSGSNQEAIYAGSLGGASVSQTIQDGFSGSAEGQFNAIFNNYQLKKIKVSDTSFSFSILEKSSGKVVKYSFKRVVKNTNFNVQKAFVTDNEKFGFFTSNVFKYKDFTDNTEGDLEQLTLRNHMNTNQKVINFRFSTLTPVYDEKLAKNDPNYLKIDYREIARRVIKQWNRVFELAETGMKFQILDGDAELGDLDVNIINIVNTIAGGSGLYGVGPTLSDPETGEVVSGTVNMYTGGIIDTQAEKIRNYIKYKTGQVKESGFLAELTKESPIKYTGIAVEHSCPSVVKYISDYNSDNGQVTINSKRSSEEVTVINSCLEKTLAKIFSFTLSHEMGHTPIQLKHNFEGDSDYKNSLNTFAKMEQMYPREDFPWIYDEYYPNDDVRLLPQSSSIMDYLSFDVDFPYFAVPGLYDLAAVTFAYGNKAISKKDENDESLFGSFVDINHETSLQDQVEDKNLNLTNFKYCDDQDDIFHLKGPMCAKTIYGKNPNQLMDSLFTKYRYHLLFSSKRIDRGRFTGASGSFRRVKYIGAMSDIYLYYRKKLREVYGLENQYLDDLFEEQLLDAEVLKNSKQNAELAEYVGVNNKFLKYMKAIVNIPNYYCVVTKQTDAGIKKVDYFEFTQLQSKLSGQGIYNAQGCLDPKLVDYVGSEQSGIGMDVVGEIGHPIDDIKFNINRDTTKNSIDIKGISEDKDFATWFLFGRLLPYPTHVIPMISGSGGGMLPLALRNVLMSHEVPISPSLSDEKQFVLEIKELAESRLLNGVELKPYLMPVLQGSESDALSNSEMDLPSQVSYSFPTVKSVSSEWNHMQDALVKFVGAQTIGKVRRETLSSYRLGQTTSQRSMEAYLNDGTLSASFRLPENLIVGSFSDSLFAEDLINKLMILSDPYSFEAPFDLLAQNNENNLNIISFREIKKGIDAYLPTDSDNKNQLKYTDVKKLYSQLSSMFVPEFEQNGQPRRDQQGQPVVARWLIDDVKKVPELYNFILMVGLATNLETASNDILDSDKSEVTVQFNGEDMSVTKEQLINYAEAFKRARVHNSYKKLAEELYGNPVFIDKFETTKNIVSAIFSDSPNFVSEWNKMLDEKISANLNMSSREKKEETDHGEALLNLLRILPRVGLSN